jgi:acyl transferase domain-containing protein
MDYALTSGILGYVDNPYKNSILILTCVEQIPSELTSLPGNKTIRVSVNSFGYGGTNGHVILESWSSIPNPEPITPVTKVAANGCSPSVDAVVVNGSNGVIGKHATGSHVNGTNGGAVTEDVKTNGITDAHAKDSNSNGVNGMKANTETSSDSPQLFVLSAKSEKSLSVMANNLRVALSESQGAQTSLDDIAYTLSSRRTVMHWRSSFVASNVEELTSALNQNKKPTRSSANISVNFLFTGQGAQWFAMGRELISDSEVFQMSISESDKMLKTWGCTWSLVEELQKDEHSSRLSQSDISQPTSTAVQIALVDLLESLNIRPRTVLGHSSGEIAAAYAAGALSHEVAMEV